MMHRLLGAALLAGLASCGAPDAAPAPQTLFVVDDEGGTFIGEGEFAGLKIIAPPAVVVHETTIAITLIGAASLDGGTFVGPVFDFGPAELALQRPLTLQLPFDATRASEAGSSALKVGVWRDGPDGWTFTPPERLDLDGSLTITVEPPIRLGAGVSTQR